MEVKRGLWGRGREEDWLLIFQHDHRIPWGYLAPDAKGLSDRE
jgi:hypothetical protein